MALDAEGFGRRPGPPSCPAPTPASGPVAILASVWRAPGRARIHPRCTAAVILSTAIAAAAIASCRFARPTPTATSSPPIQGTPRVAALAVTVTATPPVLDVLTTSTPAGVSSPVTRPTAISYTVQAVAFPSGSDVRPGAWSPTGEALLASVVVRRPADAEVGHLWTVDAAGALPLWDCGDMEGPVGDGRMAAWLGDGTLALARRDGLRIHPDGRRAVTETLLEGQPRAVCVAPDGETLFVDGADDSWIVLPDGSARIIADRPTAGFATWSWRPDGGALALSSPEGEYFLVDVVTATATSLVPPPLTPPTRVTAASWLVDGRILLPEAVALEHEDGTAYAHLIVSPATFEARPLHELLGLAPLPVTPTNLSPLPSPIGRHVLYAEAAVDSTARTATATASRLYDVVTSRVLRLPVLDSPAWSPDGQKLAYLNGGRLTVWSVATGATVAASADITGVNETAWSPDANWLAFRGGNGSLYATSADGRLEPVMVAQGVIWNPAPTWAPSSDRFAATIVDSDGESALALIALSEQEIDRFRP